MKIALNGATTMRADLTTDIQAASAAGYELIEIWAAKLYEFLKTNTVADLKTLLQQNNLEPYSINSIEHITFRNAEDYQKIKAETEELSRIAGEINCPYVVVVPGKLPENATEEEIAFGDTRILVRRVINTLPPAQQQAINLAFFRGMSQREIAAKTNTPLGTVKTRLELGLKKIYDGLKELRDEL